MQKETNVKNILVSVVITTCKREMSLLSRALNTVQQQTEKRLEIIVVNDYPPYEERIRQLLQHYPEVIFIPHSQNSGACQSRNDGLSAAKGKYIAFLDDDDEWFPEKIRLQLAYLQDTNADMVYCSGVSISADGNSQKIPYIYDPGEEKLRFLLRGNYMGGCSFPLIKKELLERTGGFDKKMPSSQDLDLWIRIAQKGKICYLDQILVKYHPQEESISSSYDRQFQGSAMLIQKHAGLYRQYPDEFLSFCNLLIHNAVSHRRKDILMKICRLSFLVFPKNYKVLLHGAKELLKLICRTGQ